MGCQQGGCPQVWGDNPCDGPSCGQWKADDTKASSSMKHTKEPWVFDTYGIIGGERDGETGYYIQQMQGRQIADLIIKKEDIATGEQGHNARRICAAVNATKGISTELLETGVLQELLESCKFMAQDYYCRMNPAQMPTLAKRAFDTFTRIEAAKEG